MAVPNINTLGNMIHCTFITPGGTVTIPNIDNVEYQREEEHVLRQYISGKRMPYSFPRGWSGSFTFDRTNPTVEQSLITTDTRMDANGTYENWTITLTIVDPTGGGSYALTFDEAAVSISRGGTFRQNSVVTMTCHFVAATMNY